MQVWEGEWHELLLAEIMVNITFIEVTEEWNYGHLFIGAGFITYDR